MKSQLRLVYCTLIAFSFFTISCSKDITATRYKTRNVIVVVVDGARYTETWGDSNHQYIPHRFSMLSKGVLCSNFHNNGVTSTVPGHTAMCTGFYEAIDNGGLEYPSRPSVFQYWLKNFPHLTSSTWVISTKDKLEVLSDCKDINWQGQFRPSTDCGNSGLGSGYRDDSTTFVSIQSKLANNHIRLAIVNFKQPDAAGHANDSLAYLKGIFDTDKYIYQLWQQIQNDPFYKDQTTLFVTNDHGRHTAGHLDGFVSHGDNCDGCRHIELFGIGPDFKQNYISKLNYEQIDISNTIAELMGFNIPTSDGKVMIDLFK